MLCRTSATCQRDDEYELAPTQSNCVFVGGCGKSRVIAALQHFAACWGVDERLRRPACSWAAPRCTDCSAHSVPSQLSTSMRTTASRCTTEALKVVLEVLWMLVMVPPSRRCWPRSTSACALLAGPRWASSSSRSRTSRWRARCRGSRVVTPLHVGCRLAHQHARCCRSHLRGPARPHASVPQGQKVFIAPSGEQTALRTVPTPLQVTFVSSPFSFLPGASSDRADLNLSPTLARMPTLPSRTTRRRACRDSA
jgi:hypothetical protein